MSRVRRPKRLRGAALLRHQLKIVEAARDRLVLEMDQHRDQKYKLEQELEIANSRLQSSRSDRERLAGELQKAREHACNLQGQLQGRDEAYAHEINKIKAEASIA